MLKLMTRRPDNLKQQQCQEQHTSQFENKVEILLEPRDGPPEGPAESLGPAARWPQTLRGTLRRPVSRHKKDLNFIFRV